MNDLLPGKKLGKFIIEKLIGKGGMASVYLATHEQLGTKVAIKILKPDFSDNTEMIERFLREARTAAQLRHPNIVRVHDIDQIDNIIYFVMDYIQGCSLKEYLKEQQPLSENTIILISIQVLSALNEAHSKGIIHRDIKPDNIIIAQHARAFVTDFGIAKATQDADLTRAGMFLGTARYASPEQIKGEIVGPRSEIYSWGIVMYEMVTRQTVFKNFDTNTILYKITHETLPSPTTILPSVSDSISNVIIKAIAINKEERFGSALEMADALQRCLSQNDGDTLLSGDDTTSPILHNDPDATRYADLVSDATKLIDSEPEPTRIMIEKREEKKGKSLLFFVILTVLCVVLPSVAAIMWQASRFQDDFKQNVTLPLVVKKQDIGQSNNKRLSQKEKEIEFGKTIEEVTTKVTSAPAILEKSEKNSTETAFQTQPEDKTVQKLTETTSEKKYPILLSAIKNTEHTPKNMAENVDRKKQLFVNIAPSDHEVTQELPGNANVDIQIWTNKARYRVGEKIQVNFRVKSNCYVYLYHESAGGDTQLIFPNKFDGNNFIVANKTYTIPDASYNFEFIAQPPFGIERIKAFVTHKEEVSLKWRSLGVRGLRVKAKELHASTTLQVVQDD